MVEQSERDVYYDNEHYDNVRNCDHIRGVQSNIQRYRERGDLGNCVLGPRQVNCN